MSKAKRYEHLLDEQLRSIDAICESFKSDLLRKVPTTIEDKIANVSDLLRQHLVPDLVAIELEIEGLTPGSQLVSDYVARFPDHATDVHQVFDELESANVSVSLTAGSMPNISNARTFAEGMVISDRYSLETKLGEGGMGEVWIANQSQPVVRKVAIKLIKSGMDSNAVIARFELERQSIAIMEHPNIARVFDAGVTSNGSPFFAMEWVDGLPLDQYCDEKMLSPTERLKLFLPICQAVQHAHQKGIVHRDLKPTNIIVAEVDGNAIPKVIDFGVAKATNSNPIDASMATQLGTVVGTLAYMSPEQAGMTDIDIDTRSDIYSLGVVLYELLTGLRPIETQRLQVAGLPELVRVIQEEEPSRPSAKLSSHDSLPSLASARSVDPKKLTSILRGELDWIVMKCLEKERDRRYETCTSLARDIQRYLVNEPIEARPPSASYLFGKFLKRNKATVAAATAVFLALIAGIAGTSVGLIRAEQARQDAVAAQLAETDRAEGERIAKLEAKKQTSMALQSAEQEKSANYRAQKRLSQIEKSNEILSDIFISLDPKEIAESNEPLQVMLVGKVIEAAKQLEGNSIGDSVMVAKMQADLGLSLIGLSASADAIGLFEKSYATYKAELGSSDRNALLSLYNLAEAHLVSGHTKVAIPMYEQALHGLLENGDSEEQLISTVQSGLAVAYAADGNYSKAVPMLEQAVEQKRSATW